MGQKTDRLCHVEMFFTDSLESSGKDREKCI